MSQPRRSTLTAPAGPTPFKIFPIAQQLSLEEVVLPSNTGPSNAASNPANNAAASIRAATSSLFRVGQSTSSVSTPNPASSPTPPTTASSAPAALSSGAQHTVKSSVEAVQLCGNNVFIGTSEGYVLHYALELEEADSDREDKGDVQRKIPLKRFLGMGRKAVDDILAVPTESKLVALCDSSLTFYDMDTLQPVSSIQRISGVMSFCGDRLLHSPMRFCVGKRRVLSVMLMGDTVTSEKEIPMPDGALILQRVGSIVCAADTGSYKIINLNTAETIPLFSYDRAAFRPTLTCIGETGEFLVVTAGNQAQSALGVFVSSSGDPVKGTLQWPMVPKSIAYHFPYIAALLRNNTIHIHNIFSQDLVQIIKLPSNAEPRYLVEASFELDVPAGNESRNPGTVRLVVACREMLLGLKMSSLDFQVNELLEAKKVERAVTLAEDIVQAQQMDNDGGAGRLKLQKLYQRAGFLYLQETLFEEALRVFKKGQLDPRALLCLFPAYSSPADFTSITDQDLLLLIQGVGSIHKIVDTHFNTEYPNADSDTLESFRVALIANAKDVLVKYLEFARDGPIGMGRKEEIDATLLRIHADDDLKSLYTLLDSNHHIRLEDGEAILSEAKRYHALSLLYQKQGLISQCLDMWMKLASGEVADPDFGGTPQIVGYLSTVQDDDIIWKYAKALLKLDAPQGIRIFTTATDEARFKTDDVISYLQQHHPDSVSAYYEHLIYQKGVEDEERHTSLAMIYTDRVLDLSTEMKVAAQDSEFKALDARRTFQSFISSLADKTGDKLANARNKLMRFLNHSDKISLMPVKSKLEAVPTLYAEHAILLGKLGEHEAALRILVTDMRDFMGAEIYCSSTIPTSLTVKRSSPIPLLVNTPNTSPTRDQDNKRLSRVSMLSTTGPESDVARRTLLFQLFTMYVKDEKKDELADEILRLLGVYGGDFDAVQVLKWIPDHWSLNMLVPFISASSRRSIHVRREVTAMKALARGENLKVNNEYVDIHLETPAMRISPASPSSNCAKCRLPINDSPPVFCRYLQMPDEIFHLHCRVGNVENGSGMTRSRRVSEIR
ncbi:hypothetical protein SeMB42_g02687 [Synchytrium endobioticum]|uniref:CNH domain-containing protein n=1 Tax=Synchytrium endobioticum TaxID=286115 RepID=A0A507DCI8_9FUNG|nr:hypothetical protein SeMB42_g02687 [Synchytrium endobioticum]